MPRFDLTDAEWALIEPHVPVAATGPLPRRVRNQFNGILWQFLTGSGWRDVPERYGPWSTAYSRFNAWVEAGVFQTLMQALIAEAASRGQVGLEPVGVDSTIVRAHHESAGLAIAGETLDALEQALTEGKGSVAHTAAGDAPRSAPDEVDAVTSADRDNPCSWRHQPAEHQGCKGDHDPTTRTAKCRNTQPTSDFSQHLHRTRRHCGQSVKNRCQTPPKAVGK
ncbi:transposase [Actinosynnema sp. NPDC023794]